MGSAALRALPALVALSKSLNLLEPISTAEHPG